PTGNSHGTRRSVVAHSAFLSFGRPLARGHRLVPKAVGPDILPPPDRIRRGRPSLPPAARPALSLRWYLLLLFRWPLSVFGFAAPEQRCVARGHEWSLRTAA